jgi:hypothetical protein
MVSVGSITGRDKAKNMTFLFVASTLSTYHLGMRAKTGCLWVSIMYLSWATCLRGDSCLCAYSRRVPLMEQELLTIPEYLSSPPVFSGVRAIRYLVVCIVCCRSVFILFLLAIVLSVLQFMDFDYTCSIFKFSLQWARNKCLSRTKQACSNRLATAEKFLTLC